MARTLYGGTGGDVLAQVDAQGDFAPSTATYAVFTTRTGSTQLTDLQAFDGTAVTTVTPDATGRVLFFGPNPYNGEAWLRDQANQSATRWRVDPADEIARLSALEGATAPVTAHSALSGLAADDHPQYHNDTRGDARYPLLTAGKVNASVLPDSIGKFGLEFNLSGQVDVGDVVSGGIPFLYDETVDRIIASLDVEARGANFVISFVKRARADGVETTLGTVTINSPTSRRGTLSGLAASFLAGDRLYSRITQVGSNQPGSDLMVRVGGTAMTIPAALSTPGLVPSLTAAASGADVVVTATAPTTGVYSSIDLYRDGVFMTRLPRGTLSFTDSGSAADAHTYRANPGNNDAVAVGTSVSYTPAVGLTTPQNIATGTSTTAGGATVSGSVNAPVAAGQTVVVMVGTTGSGDTFTCTDSKGNTYAVDVVDTAAGTGAGVQSATLRSKLTTALVAGDTITVTDAVAGGRDRFVMSAFAVGGLHATAPLDKTQTNNVGATFTKNFTTTASAVLAQASEVAFACFVTNIKQTIVAPGSSWSMGTLASTSNGVNDKTLIPLWQVVSATAAVTATATGDVAGKYSACLSTYKAA